MFLKKYQIHERIQAVGSSDCDGGLYVGVGKLFLPKVLWIRHCMSRIRNWKFGKILINPHTPKLIEKKS
jgi:hypothetical protein